MTNGNLMWVITGGILTMIVGYVLGREHAKKEVRSTLRKKLPSMPW